MDSLKSQIKKDVSNLASEKIDRLSLLWKSLFEPDIGNEHLRSLVEHVEAFFSDIIAETENRQCSINLKIASLKKERAELKRLLKEDANDVSEANVPLHTLQMNIDESLSHLREKLEARRLEVSELNSEESAVCDEMNEISRPLMSDPLPSEDELQNFKDYLDKLRDEKYNRFAKIMQLRGQIESLMKKLEISTLSDYEDNLMHSSELKPTNSNIDKLEQLYDKIDDQYHKMEYQMTDMRKRLAQLWKYLDVTEAQQHKFDKYSEVIQSNYDRLLGEVQRCETIKRDNIKIFIERVRLEIEEYWDKCLVSPSERMKFQYYKTDNYNEDVLEIHETEVDSLKKFYENHENIFKLIKERNELWSQLEILQNKEQDPKRYNNRGGQLLKEEKERKMLINKLPKIEDKLIQICNQYEMENNKPFTINGVRVQDVIEGEHAAKRQEKITKSGKKVQATPLRTPGRVNMSTLRTPLTVEQTLQNRTGLKTTGARMRPAISKPNLLCTTTSSTASSVVSVQTENGKRRMLLQRSRGPQAKRQLLTDFVSPNKIQIPSATRQPLRMNNGNVSRGASKKPTIRVYNTGSIIKRRSQSRKSVGKKRRSSMLKKARIPEIVLSDLDDAPSSNENATLYEGFESYASSSKKVVRSSVIERPKFLAVNHYAYASPFTSAKKQKRLGTPSASTPTRYGNEPKILDFSEII